MDVTQAHFQRALRHHFDKIEEAIDVLCDHIEQARFCADMLTRKEPDEAPDR